MSPSCSLRKFARAAGNGSDGGDDSPNFLGCSVYSLPHRSIRVRGRLGGGGSQQALGT
jgi:hypothetical protein